MSDIQQVCSPKIFVIVVHPGCAGAFCGGKIAKPIQTVKLCEQLAVDAILQHSSRLAIQALLFHPLVLSFTRLTKLVGEYLHVHTAYIGEWRDHA